MRDFVLFWRHWGRRMHIFLIAYFGAQMVAMQPMTSMEECRALAANAARQLQVMALEWAVTEGRGMDPRWISFSCVNRDMAPVPKSLD